MKNRLFTIGTVIALALSTVFTVAISNAVTSDKATPTTGDQLSLTTESELSPSPSFISPDESVFIIADHTGTPTKSFIGSSLNTSATEFPFNIQVTYNLDGKEISADDIVGKSGHIMITYAFTSTKSYQDKLVPFLAITGLDLDTTKFSHVHIDHGKVIKESANNLILAGITMPGLNHDLGTDFLPDSFTITADTTDFAINDTYTLITNDFFTDIDTSKLSSIDDLISAINQLSTALDQIIAGSSQLTNGLDSAFDGAKSLESGIAQVSTGANELASGADQVNSGAHELASGAHQLSNGLTQVVSINDQIMAHVTPVTSTIDDKIVELKSKITILSETDPDLANDLSSLLDKITSYYTEANTAINRYVDGIQSLSDGARDLATGADQLATGTDTLASGAHTLATGTDQLSNGAHSLVDGMSQLSSGSHTLTSGLNDFKSQGIAKLTDFANRDLSHFTNNLRATISAAKSYRHYTIPNATSVKFIVKTPALSKTE